MSRVTSKDGTAIAYERSGRGPSVILVGGGLDDGSENAPLATELADRFTVINYARRGRGESNDTQPYALEREVEDLDALIVEAGGSAHVYGVSSGGALAIEAAAAGSAIDRLAMYEVPYLVADEMRASWGSYLERLAPALAEGRRGDAIELFMQVAGSSEEDIEGARRSPFWPGLEALAHTLAYDAACLGDGRPPVDRLRAITQPTLVATGGGDELFERAADEIVEGIPGSQRIAIEGQGTWPTHAWSARSSSGSCSGELSVDPWVPRLVSPSTRGTAVARACARRGRHGRPRVAGPRRRAGAPP